MSITRRAFTKYAGAAAAGLMFRPYADGAQQSSDHQLTELLKDKAGNVINSIPAWEVKRKEIKECWQAYLGFLKPDSNKPSVSILNEEKTGPLIRQLIEYESGQGDLAQAYLIRPAVISQTLPGVVALHSTSDNKMLYISGVEKGDTAPLGYDLAMQGVVVICPMCFLWRNRGERGWEQQAQRFISSHPGSKGMAKMLFDGMRAVDVLCAFEFVDRGRIGAVGHSLGGKEAFYLGAFDDRVTVIVSNEGGIGIDFSNWDDLWYLGKEIHNFGHQHHELLALCAPKPFLLIGGDYADGKRSIPYIDAVKPVYKLYGKPDNLSLFNHGSGHEVTAEAKKRTYDWIVKYL